MLFGGVFSKTPPPKEASTTGVPGEMVPGSTEVTAVVLHGPRDLRAEKRILPPPADNEVRIKIACTTLCGSDLHYYTSYRNGSIQVKHPLVLGHESCGYITAVGPSVENLHIGDLVAIEPGIPCGICDLCTIGRYNICPTLRFRSSAKSVPHYDGTLQTQINHPATHVFKLPSTMSPELGALIEPLAVAMHAHTRARLPMGSSILVLGGGAIGLLVAAVAKTRGLRVVIVDLQVSRVKFAMRNGFAEKGVVVPTLPPPKDKEEKLKASEDLAEQIGGAHWPGSRGHSHSRSSSRPSSSAGGSSNCSSSENLVGQVDAVFECTGSESGMQTAIYATRPGGKVLMIGMGSPVQTLPVAQAALREVDLLGIFRYAGAYEQAVGLAGSGDPSLPDLEGLISHKVVGVTKAKDAFELTGKGDVIKAAFYFE